MAENQAFDEARVYLAILHKRRMLVVTCAAAGLSLAALYSYTARSVYQASAQLLIAWRTPNVLPNQNLIDAPVGGPDYQQTHQELLRGRDLAQRVIERLGAPIRAELAKSATSSPLAWLRRRGQSASAESAPARDDAALWVDAFRARVSVDPVPGTRLVNVGFRAYDPQLAAEAANVLAETYITQSLDERSLASTAATGWLDERLVEQQRRVAEADQSLQAYREREGLVSIAERRTTVEQKLAALTAAEISARTERVAKETLHEHLRGLSRAELLAFPLVKSNSVIAGLRARLAELREEESRLSDTLGDRHPDLLAVRARITRAEEQMEGELSEIVRSVEADYRTALETEKNLQASVEEAKQETLFLGRKVLAGDALERAAETNRKLLHDLMSRSKEAGLEAELRTTDVRLWDRARVPGGPIAPRRTRNHVVGLFFGLGLGIGLALLLDRLDNTLKTPEDVKVHLRVPFLGIVPEIGWSSPARGDGTTVPGLVGPESAVAETYRVLRTNLIFSSAEATGRVYVVTSARPGDGKTTTVGNLAAALAHNGARVLAVDADLRRPTLHLHFGLEMTPGLSDLIVGTSSLADVAKHTSVRGLQVVPCGYQPPNPAELLGSNSLKELIGVLRKRFDWVLFDAPPVLAMADAMVLGGVVDGAVLVVRADETPLPSVHRAVDQLVGVGARLTGIVLNRVDLERNAYYYGQYYGEHYRSYYARPDESSSAVRSIGR